MNAKLSHQLAVLLVLFLALWVRILYVENLIVDIPIRGDAFYYTVYANNLIEHGVFSKQQSDYPIPDSFWAPGYPVFIAMAIKLAGDQFYPFILYAQALLGSLVCGLTVMLGLLYLPLWASVAAGILAVFSPHLISIGGYVLTETLFSFALLLSLYGFCLAVLTSRKILFFLSGIGFGLAYLINPVVIFAPILIGVFWFYIQHGRNQQFSLKNSWRRLALFWFPLVIIVMAWGIRNHLNVPEGSETSSGRALLAFIIGAHDDYFDYWWNNPRDPANPATLDQIVTGNSWIKFISLLGHRILQDPLHYIKWYFIEKPVLFLSWNILVGWGDIYVYRVLWSLYGESSWMFATYSIMKALHWCFVIFGLSGLIFIFWPKNKNEKELVQINIYVVIISISAIYVLLSPDPRYSIPLRPELYLCAIYFIVKSYEFYKDFMNKRSGQG